MDVFTTGGVTPGKLVVVPESVDTQFFNPGTTLPLPAGNAYGVGTSVRRVCSSWLPAACAWGRAQCLVGLFPLVGPCRGAPRTAACCLLPAVCGRSLNDSCSLAELAVVHDAVLHGLV